MACESRARESRIHVLSLARAYRKILCRNIGVSNWVVYMSQIGLIVFSWTTLPCLKLYTNLWSQVVHQMAFVLSMPVPWGSLVGGRSEILNKQVSNSTEELRAAGEGVPS